MSDYKNGDTASWDASQVRRSQGGQQPGGGQRRPSQQRRRKRRRINPVLYILCVLVASAILAGVGWLLASDLCAFNRDIPSTTKITIEVTADDDMGSIAEKLQDAGEHQWEGEDQDFAQERAAAHIHFIAAFCHNRSPFFGASRGKSSGARTVKIL